MNTIKIILLALLIYPASCHRQPDETLIHDDLVGRWEDKKSPEPGFLIKNIYGSAIELRHNGEFDVYYWSKNEPDPGRSLGDWKLVNGDRLILLYASRADTLEVSQFEGTTMTLEHRLSGEIHRMTKK